MKFHFLLFLLLAKSIHSEYNKGPDAEGGGSYPPADAPKSYNNGPQPPLSEVGGNSDMYTEPQAPSYPPTKQEPECSCPAAPVCTTPAPCEACPDPPPPVTCPAPPPPTPCVSSEPYTPNTYTEPTTYNSRGRRIRAKRAKATTVVHLMNKCNDNQLRLIMLQSLSQNIVATKVTIAKRAAREIGGVFNVICANGVFSYYAAAKVFCEVTRENTSCFAFRHDVIDGSKPASSDTNQEKQNEEIIVIPETKKDDKGKTAAKRFSDQLAQENRFWEKIAVATGKNTNLAENNTTDLSKELVRTTLKPKNPEDPVIDIHTQNLREETFQELLKQLEESNNDGST